MWHLDDYPLVEEIGNPELFVGREQEMTRLLEWAEEAKRLQSKSMGILSRRKKGKTALLQRFFNILYMRNDPRLIPFYYRIPQNVQTKSDFTRMFYRRILTQYFAFTTRTPKWVRMVLPMDALKELAASDEENAQKIVLYLAKHEPEERDRTQILQDLGLDMTDKDLAERLKKLVYADILAQGSSNFHYRGLGDRVFAMVFRRIYGAVGHDLPANRPCSRAGIPNRPIGASAPTPTAPRC